MHKTLLYATVWYILLLILNGTKKTDILPVEYRYTYLVYQVAKTDVFYYLYAKTKYNLA